MRLLAKSDVQLGDAAIRALDESLADVRAVIGDEDPVASRILDLVSPEAAAAGDLRAWATDALILVATVLGRLGRPPSHVSSPTHGRYQKHLGCTLLGSQAEAAAVSLGRGGDACLSKEGHPGRLELARRQGWAPIRIGLERVIDLEPL